MDTLAVRIESILADDDKELPQLNLGSSEQQLGQVVLLLVAVPALSLPPLFHTFGKNLSWAVFLLALYLSSVFLVLQYRLQWLLYLSQQVHARVRV